MVFCRGAQHRRPADVDRFDEARAIGMRRERVLERIKIDDDEIERCDAVRRESRRVVLVVPHCEDARMDDRMQRLDATVEDLRKTGERCNIDMFDPGVLQRRARATARDDLHARRSQRARQSDKPGLVEYGNQCAPDTEQRGAGEGTGLKRHGKSAGEKDGRD